MSANLETHRVQQFATTVELLLQQKGSKLANFVTRGSYVGKQASPVDQFGAIEASAVTGRFQPITRTDASTDRRWVFPSDFDVMQQIDTFDRLRTINDPKGLYVQNALYAMGRKMDDVIIAAATGDAKTGESAGTTTTFSTTATTSGGNRVAVDFGASGNVGLTVFKLREAKMRLMANQVDLDNDQLICVISAKQHDDLLAQVQVISSDFNGHERPVLMDGKVSRFLGIDFVHSERLATTSSHRRCLIFAKSGMHLGQWNGFTSDVSQRKDIKGLPWQCYLYATFGATRLEEKKVFEILCAE